MREPIVIKFGGTSNSTAETVQQCVEIGGDSQILVTSAPGVLSDEQLAGFSPQTEVDEEFLAQKVTRQSLTAHAEYVSSGEIPVKMLNAVTERYREIVDGLGITSLQGEWLDSIAPRLAASISLGEEYASMAGERFQSEIYRAMGWRMLDPARAPGALSPREPDTWRAWLQPAVDPNHRYILPGNTYNDGTRLRTFGSGGSDISGACAAYGIDVDIYKNMTDTPAQSADPDIVKDPARRRTIRHLTYPEGRELGRNGTGLLHPEAIVPLMGSGILTHVCNTFSPESPHTVYSDEVDGEGRAGQVQAISLLGNIAVISVHEPGMSESHGRIAALAGHLAEADMNTIDIVGDGSDTELFIVDGNDQAAAADLLGEVTRHNSNIGDVACSLVTLVGYKLRNEAANIQIRLQEELKIDGDSPFTDALWFPAQHSLRFTVPQDMAEQVVDRTHSLVIENR